MKKIILLLHSLTNHHCWVRLSCTRSPLHSFSDLGITWSPTPHSWPTLRLPRELLLTQQLPKTQFHEDMMSSRGIQLQANVETGSYHKVQLPGHLTEVQHCCVSPQIHKYPELSLWVLWGPRESTGRGQGCDRLSGTALLPSGAATCFPLLPPSF